MKRYILRYLFFLTPALLVSLFFRNASAASQVLQWFTAFFMVLGWAVNTGMAAYYYPRDVLGLMLVYAGANLALINLVYHNTWGSRSGWLGELMGAASFTPLQIFVRALIDLNIQQEVYVLAGMVACCAAGYLAGLLARRIYPNPYHPRIEG
jgi:hypothetical protein